MIKLFQLGDGEAGIGRGVAMLPVSLLVLLFMALMGEGLNRCA